MTRRAGCHTNCIECRRVFYVQRCKILEGKGIYCSRACLIANKSKPMKCTNCGLSVRFQNNRIQRAKRLFCSYKCHYESMRGVSKPFNCQPLKNEHHPFWKGDNVGYRGLHVWLRRNYGIPGVCDMCGNQNDVQWANSDGVYKRDRQHWRTMCRPCHAKFDAQRRKERTPLTA